MPTDLPHLMSIRAEGGRAPPGPAAPYLVFTACSCSNEKPREKTTETRMKVIQKRLNPYFGSSGDLRLYSCAVSQVCTPVYTPSDTQPLLSSPPLTKLTESTPAWILPERKGRIQVNLLISEMGKSIPALLSSQSFSEGHM